MGWAVVLYCHIDLGVGVGGVCQNEFVTRESPLSLAKTLADRRINSLQPYFPSLIGHNFLPCSACFCSGSEPCFAFSVAAGVLFWRISDYANRSPFENVDIVVRASVSSLKSSG